MKSTTHVFTRFKQLWWSLLLAIACCTDIVVFFVDDVQWANPNSIDLIHTIAKVTRARNILFIFAFRDNATVERTQEERNRWCFSLDDKRCEAADAGTYSYRRPDTNDPTEMPVPLADIAFGEPQRPNHGRVCHGDAGRSPTRARTQILGLSCGETKVKDEQWVHRLTLFRVGILILLEKGGLLLWLNLALFALSFHPFLSVSVASTPTVGFTIFVRQWIQLLFPCIPRRMLRSPGRSSTRQDIVFPSRKIPTAWSFLQLATSVRGTPSSSYNVPFPILFLTVCLVLNRFLEPWLPSPGLIAMVRDTGSSMEAELRRRVMEATSKVSSSKEYDRNGIPAVQARSMRHSYRDVKRERLEDGMINEAIQNHTDALYYSWSPTEIETSDPNLLGIHIGTMQNVMGNSIAPVVTSHPVGISTLARPPTKTKDTNVQSRNVPKVSTTTGEQNEGSTNSYVADFNDKTVGTTPEPGRCVSSLHGNNRTEPQALRMTRMAERAVSTRSGSFIQTRREVGLKDRKKG